MSMLRSSLRGALFTVVCVAYAASAKAQCEITGSTVICPDSSVTLCAPTAPGYRWADTEGNVMSTNQCVTVLTPGTYRVYTYDPGLDMWWGCAHTVSVAPPESCFVAPPAPPRIDPLPDTLACPRPASWWARQCRREGDRRALMSMDELEAIGACVDARSDLFGWNETAGGLCRVLRQHDFGDLRARTYRQFAAVLANLCASSGSMTRRDGRLYGIGEDAVFRTFFGATTVGAWVDATESELAQLQGASLKDKGVRAAYRRIFGEAWAIGHGVGLKVGCPMPSSDDEEDSSVMAALGSEADLEQPLSPVAMPNPFHGSTRFAFTVPDASGADVDMSVFDVAGRRMASLARGRYGVGSHVVQWDGRGLDGSRARAGMYFLRGRIGNVDVTTSVMKIESGREPSIRSGPVAPSAPRARSA
jgi:hypothetical protein